MCSLTLSCGMLISAAGCVGTSGVVDLYCLRDKPLGLSDSEIRLMPDKAAMAVIVHDFNYACRCLSDPPEECSKGFGGE